MQVAERLARQIRTPEADGKVVSVGEFLEGPSGQNNRHILLPPGKQKSMEGLRWEGGG